MKRMIPLLVVVVNCVCVAINCFAQLSGPVVVRHMSSGTLIPLPSPVLPDGTRRHSSVAAIAVDVSSGWSAGDMLHLASVPFGRTLRIGNFLSIATDIDDVAGLKGQVAINARGLTAGFEQWTGTTRVRTASGNFVTLQDANSVENTYAASASSLGGGAIGVARYVLHDEDCIPGEGTESNPAQFTQTGFNNGGGIVLTEYDRLTVVPVGAEAVTITRGETPVNSLFEVTLGTGAATRQIKIRPKAVGYPAQRLPVAIGKYRIEPTAALRCDDTFFENDPPAVAPFTYVVCVVRDCDHDGMPDSGDPSCS